MSKKFQIFRSSSIYTTRANAVAAISSASFLNARGDGEVVSARYLRGSTIVSVFGIVAVNGSTRSITIFDDITDITERLESKSDKSHTHTVKHTPSGTVSSTFEGIQHKHTFTGTASETLGDGATKTIKAITAVGTAPELSSSIADKCMTLSFSAGTLPTTSDVVVPTAAHKHSFTPAGTIGMTTAGGNVTSTFTGTEASLTTSQANK